MAPALSTLSSSAMHWLFANSRAAAIARNRVFMMSTPPAFGTAIGLTAQPDRSLAHFSAWVAGSLRCFHRRAAAQSREVFMESIGAQHDDEIAVVGAIGRNRHIGKHAFGGNHVRQKRQAILQDLGDFP